MSKVFLRGPVGEKTRNKMNGKVYGIEWTNGYAGPFDRDHRSFKLIRASLPMGTSYVEEDVFLASPEGYEFLKEQRDKYDKFWAMHMERLAKAAMQDVSSREHEQKRFKIREMYGLLDIDQDLMQDIRIGLDDDAKITQRLASWRRVLKHVSENGKWDRTFFGSELKEEWNTFSKNVLCEIVDDECNLLPVESPEKTKALEEAEKLVS